MKLLNMENRKYLWIAILVVFAVGCGAPKVITSHKSDAENAAKTGNFAQAVQAWQMYFNQHEVEEVAGDDFANAAKTAFKAGDSNLALNWFDQARYKTFADAEMYETLAKIYRSQENISKELSALEFYSENFSTESNQVNNRLFEIYSEIDLNDKALQVWELLTDESKNEMPKLNQYFLLKKAQKDSIVCDSLSLVLLEREPENQEALEWNAKKYYWLGQNRYEREMAKYNKKKTTRQYKILLKELELVTADFKRALPYLKKLWEMENGKKYAGYFTNIYARFGDEKKSDYYKQFIK